MICYADIDTNVLVSALLSSRDDSGYERCSVLRSGT